MELRHLRYFITVAEELSFSKAALKLHTAQPSLSQQIKDLEDDIGVQLFHRTKRKVELTEEGLVFLEQARLTLTQADKAITMARQVAAAKVQYLKIGFVPSAEIRIFPYILPRLRVKLPKLQIRTLNLKESDQIAELKKGDLDIIFINQEFQNEVFASQLILKEPLVFMLPKQHPLAQLTEIPVGQLNGLAITVLSQKLSQPHPRKGIEIQILRVAQGGHGAAQVGRHRLQCNNRDIESFSTGLGGQHQRQRHKGDQRHIIGHQHRRKKAHPHQYGRQPPGIPHPAQQGSRHCIK